MRNEMCQPSGSLISSPPVIRPGQPRDTPGSGRVQRNRHTSDKRDCHLAPATTQAGDAELRGLRNVDHKAGAALLVPGRPCEALTEAIPRTEVVLENLLGSLGRQLGQPFPARKRIGAGGAELVVDLRYRRAPSDAAVAARVPLVKQVPQRPGGVPLSVQPRRLHLREVDPSGVRTTPHRYRATPSCHLWMIDLMVEASTWALVGGTASAGATRAAV